MKTDKCDFSDALGPRGMGKKVDREGASGCSPIYNKHFLLDIRSATTVLRGQNLEKLFSLVRASAESTYLELSLLFVKIFGIMSKT